ncbi:MAG: hypothetical protein JXP73_16015 [Deltaproteobacteria bacterium]|nr:hypothetical protein [Deltaproteobacteria bacterium]
MALFGGNKSYDRWKKEVDDYPVLEKGGPKMSPQALMANIAGGAALVKRIKEAAVRGELTASEASELVTRLQTRARRGLGAG